MKLIGYKQLINRDLKIENSHRAKRSFPWGFILLIILLPLFFINCSGKESFSIDDRPPDPVIMIPHLGDIGDSIYVNGELVNDNNSGISTVPENDWIRIQWKPVLDPKLDYVKVYRFSDQNSPTFVDSLNRTLVDTNEYLDTRLHTLNPFQKTWSYYVECYSQYGAYSTSDTVSYGLLQKPQLIAPSDSAQLPHDSISFEWLDFDFTHNRLLVFDSDRNYIWHYDFYDDEGTGDLPSIDYMGPSLAGYDKIIWRVDSLDNVNLEGVAMSGAKSFERILYLTP